MGLVWLGGASALGADAPATLEFGPELQLNVIGRVVGARPAWFNNDRYPDLAVTAVDRASPSSPQTAFVARYLGNADGTFRFATRVDLKGATSVSGPLIADLNGDGISDVAVKVRDARRWLPGGRLLMGSATDPRGGGLYRTEHTVVALARLDADPYPDAVVRFGATQQLGVALGSGNGRFRSPQGLPDAGEREFTALALADVNRDGFGDVTAATGGADRQVMLWLGTGDGRFKTPITRELPAASGATHATHLKLADVTGDGRKDLLVTSDRTYLFPGLGRGQFGVLLPLFRTRSRHIAVGDVDGDRRADIGLPSPADLTVRLLTSGRRGSPDLRWPTTEPMDTMEFVDLNGDGRRDLLMSGLVLRNEIATRLNLTGTDS